MLIVNGLKMELSCKWRCDNVEDRSIPQLSIESNYQISDFHISCSISMEQLRKFE